MTGTTTTPPALSGPRLPPASGGAPKSLMVMLHGYGADGHDLIALGRYWVRALPDTLFVSPNAPERCAMSPMGYQWFPLSLDRTISRVTGAAAARPAIVAHLEALWAETGLGPEATYLMGFSQGAMMALHVGLSLATPLRGIIGFSGAFIPPAGFSAEAAPRTPVCLVHGEVDQVVDPALSVAAAETLTAAGLETSLLMCPNVGHGIAPEGLDFAGHFIAAQELRAKG
ncbi:MAG: alpha/beta hydrolase [Devosia sp.]